VNLGELSIEGPLGCLRDHPTCLGDDVTLVFAPTALQVDVLIGDVATYPIIAFVRSAFVDARNVLGCSSLGYIL
jgi:hypothetical protein